MPLLVQSPDNPTRADTNVAVVRFATDPLTPIMIHFLDATVEIMVAKRVALAAKTYVDRETWAVTGTYVLLGAPLDPATYKVRARPGTARGDLLKRVNQHLVASDMAWFTRAILVRDSRGLDSAEAGFLEGKLHEFCRDAVSVEHDFRIDVDESPHEWRKAELLRGFLPQIRAVLEFAGVPLGTSGDLAQPEQEVRERPPEEADAGE